MTTIHQAARIILDRCDVVEHALTLPQVIAVTDRHTRRDILTKVTVVRGLVEGKSVSGTAVQGAQIILDGVTAQLAAHMGEEA